MLIAELHYPRSSRTTRVNYPDKPTKTLRNGKRPYLCVVTGMLDVNKIKDLDAEMPKVKDWLQNLRNVLNVRHAQMSVPEEFVPLLP